MNSATWIVEKGDQRWVAKAVEPAAEPSFRAGLAWADRLDAAGVRAGAARPTVSGGLVAQHDGWPLALLTWVAGEPLTGRNPAEQRLIGRVLARVHRVLADDPTPAQSFGILDPAAEHLSVRPWVRGAVAGAVTALAELGEETLATGPLHGDPAPEAFRFNPNQTGEVGLIDWSSALRGPRLYDVASAVMYVGGPDRASALIDAYGLSTEEMKRGLPVLLRYRWAVQAHYFAHRIATNDLTGIQHSDENEQGLADAERGLAQF